MQFVKIETESQVNNEVLRERVTRAQSGKSSEYILLSNGSESGFISFEVLSDRSLGFIYEMYVLPSSRRKGLGSALLSYGEGLAKELNCTHIQLEPNAFDRTVSKDLLVSWYTKNGYLKMSDNSERMEKIIAWKQA